MNNVSLLHEIKRIDHDVFRAISNRYKSMNVDITPMHAKILMTIHKSEDKVCQKDLEGPMSCNKSTLSSIISTMEKNGLITREVSELDSRINHLVLTDKGMEMVEFLRKDRKYTDGILEDGISKSERELFMQVIDKIRENLERI